MENSSFSIIEDNKESSKEDLITKTISPRPSPFEFSKLNEKSSPAPLLKPTLNRTDSSGPSGRNRSPIKGNTNNDLSSESDLDDSDHENNKTAGKLPGEYDPNLYQNLDVDSEAKDMFQYIVKYIPQQLHLDYKFKPFIPEFLPAVGDIDAFLKVIPPDRNLSNDDFDQNNNLQLGLKVLDEPSSNQSDPALLHLQLRAASVNPSQKNNLVVVKKVDNVEKNIKTVDKWIKDISDLHKSKSSPVVRYSQPMPDLDDLMQEWPEEMENYLRDNGFPFPDDETSLTDYLSIICEMFQIPLAKNRIQSLHLLFCLYAAIKTSQLYQTSKNIETSHPTPSKTDEADQLLLE